MSPTPPGQRVGRLLLASLCCGFGLLLLAAPVRLRPYLTTGAATQRLIELRAAGALLVGFGVLILST